MQAAAPGGMNGPAREGRYYDYGSGPAGRLLLVEHTNDGNAMVTVAGVVRAPTPHFHVCSYGQHDNYRWAKPADGRNWQQFDPTVMFLPFYSTPGMVGFQTNVDVRAYELDGRFGEAGQPNTHHISLVSA